MSTPLRRRFGDFDDLFGDVFKHMGGVRPGGPGGVRGQRAGGGPAGRKMLSAEGAGGARRSAVVEEGGCAAGRDEWNGHSLSRAVAPGTWVLWIPT